MSTVVCTFCFASNSQRLITITAPLYDAAICDQCIATCAQVVRDNIGASLTFWLGAEAEHV